MIVLECEAQSKITGGSRDLREKHRITDKKSWKKRKEKVEKLKWSQIGLSMSNKKRVESVAAIREKSNGMIKFIESLNSCSFLNVE